MDPTLIVALTGVASLVLAQIAARRGERSKSAQAEAAREVEQRQVQWRERGEIIKDLRAELDRVNAERTREREECVARVTAVRVECHDARARLADTVRTLLGVVRDEVAAAAAETALADDDEHEALPGHDGG